MNKEGAIGGEPDAMRPSEEVNLPPFSETAKKIYDDLGEPYPEWLQDEIQEQT